LLGWTFFPWQNLVADVAGEYDPITKLPFYRTVGISVSRQNGKTTLICTRIARQLIAPRQTVAYTAQDRGLARTKWAEHIELLMSTPFADRVDRVERTNHREVLVMQNGSRYMPVTPSAHKAARSLSLDLAIIDEAHAHADMGVISAIQPAMAARPHAQILLASNAGDSTSGMWRHYTDVGRVEVDNPDSSMCWFEYAADPGADVNDHEAWLDANPSLGHPGGVIASALADGALTMDRATFFKEHLNVWRDSDAITGIDAVAWAACRNDELAPGTDLAIGLDITPERDRGSLCVAGYDGEDIIALEVLEATTDLEHLVMRAAAVANAWECDIVIQSGSPAASAVPALERATPDDLGGNRVRTISTPEFARACGDLHDAVVTANIAHRSDPRLNDAAIAATRRKVGDSWVWQRRADPMISDKDITPLIAATLARWGVVTAPEVLEPAVW
jgi:phage terminase large subunit-like protein